MTNPMSVKPFIKAIGWMLQKEILVAHRMVESGEGLAYYTKFPDGVIWKESSLPDVFYISMHGKPGGLRPTVKDINSSELISAFNGLGRYNNIVLFGACEVFSGEVGKQFAAEFLRKTKTNAVIGYANFVSYIDSLIIDTLFLSRFLDSEGNPFEQLQSIYDSVIRDYPRAMDCGFSIFLRED